MYLITDSYGTRKTAWTFKGALAWLACCSAEACISDRITGYVLAVRAQSRAY